MASPSSSASSRGDTDSVFISERQVFETIIDEANLSNTNKNPDYNKCLRCVAFNKWFATLLIWWDSIVLLPSGGRTGVNIYSKIVHLDIT